MEFHLFDLHILGGWERAFAIHEDDDAVVTAIQDVVGDQELYASQLLSGEVLDQCTGCNRGRLRVVGKDAWIFPLRIDDFLLQGDAVELHDDFIALDMLEQHQTQSRDGA